jgi:thiol-disulfide isomerase/thioredoxin
MLNRRRLIGTIAAIPALLLAPAVHAAWSVGETVALPPLALLDGSQLDAATLKGKVVVVQFWASWCPFCAKQNPLIESLHRTHRSRGLEVVTISIDKSRDAAVDYIRSKGYTFRAGMVTPAWNAIFRLRKGLPQVYVIGRDGRVLQSEMGEMFEEDVKAIVRHL